MELQLNWSLLLMVWVSLVSECCGKSNLCTWNVCFLHWELNLDPGPTDFKGKSLSMIPQQSSMTLSVIHCIHREWLLYIHKLILAINYFMEEHLENSIIIIGSTMSVLSQIITVCARPQVPASEQGRINISWDDLPCHLTNGADVSDYIIQYSSSSERNISTSNTLIAQTCSFWYNHHYSCLLSQSSRLLQNEVTYTFRVAARNRYGVGPFSNPVFGMIDITSIVKLLNCGIPQWLSLFMQVPLASIVCLLLHQITSVSLTQHLLVQS